MGAETQLKDIKPNRVNPRTIEEKRANALAADLEKFGDLSGIVNNVNPEWTVLVSGHQRMEVFRRGNGSLVITERYEQPEKDGTVARGFIYMDGRRYTYREVIWDRAKSDEATIKANGEYGQWDNAVLTNEWQFTVEQFQDFGVPALVFETPGNECEAMNPDDFGTGFSLPDGDRAPFQQMTFTLADEQVTAIKNAIDEIKQTDVYKYAETFGNENSNGNALYLIVQAWAGQRILL